MKYKYPVAKPHTSEEWVSSQGPDVLRLENAWAAYCGTRYAVACSSGTDAIKLALASLNIGPGDEVIVPDFTMIATAWAVTYVGARPVFVDCGADLNINVNEIERAITPKTKAIMPVHIYGRPADMKTINRIAYEYNLWVIEDAAEAHGATIDDKRVGSWGDIGCFSLYANKIITSGEGGLITTNSEKIYNQLKYLRSMAFSEEHSFLHKRMGWNDRMTNMQAKLAIEQLSHIDEFLSKRNMIRYWYDQYLKKYTIPRPLGSVLWMYDIICKNRDEVVKKLAEDGIETRVFFKPMRKQPMYKESVTKELLGLYRALEFSEAGLYLPTYFDLTQKDVEFIAKKVGKVIKKYKND